MFGIALQQTRLYQAAKAEGEQEGEQRGRQEEACTGLLMGETMKLTMGQDFIDSP